MNELHTNRVQKADYEFENYRFSNLTLIEDMDGWEFTTPGHTLSRIFYVNNDDDEDSIKASFTASFKNDLSLEIDDVSCLLMKTGTSLGSRALPPDKNW